MHIYFGIGTVGIVLVLTIVFFIGVGVGTASERRRFERVIAKLEARQRHELQQARHLTGPPERGNAIKRLLMPWRSDGG